MIRLIFVFLLVLLVSCTSAPSESDIQTAIAQTQNAVPTHADTSLPTNTTSLAPITVPLTELDMESLILQAGDLPPNYVLSVISDELPSIRLFNYLRSLPPADSIVTLDIDDVDSDVDGQRVVVLLYEEITSRDSAYNMIISSKELGDEIESLDEVGERAVVSTGEGSLFGWRYQKVVFVHCNAVAYLCTTADTANYAKRLDKRLKHLLCRDL